MSRYARRLPTRMVRVLESVGGIIAADLRAPVDLPHFDNSAMDGFVFSSKDVRGASLMNPALLKIVGSVRAGSSDASRLTHGKTYRIMTGAPIPRGADTILEKERAVMQDGFLRITQPVSGGRNIRYRGEEIAKNSKVNLCGVVITAGVIGFLSSLGIRKVRVFSKPRVSIVATGDELVSIARKLRFGQIYDSNTSMLLAALKTLMITPVIVKRVADRKRDLKVALMKALQKSDLVILTGGVSVGDYDHVKQVFQELRIRKIFWKVLQKPGKPVFFGKKGATLVFGLPGNPASVHTCFYQYVYPAIKLQMGHTNPFLKREKIVLEHDLRPDREKTMFLKARINESKGKRCCEVLGQQGSHMLSSFCRSHGFIVVPPGKKILKRGQKILFHYFPEHAN